MANSISETESNRTLDEYDDMNRSWKVDDFRNSLPAHIVSKILSMMHWCPRTWNSAIILWLGMDQVMEDFLWNQLMQKSVTRIRSQISPHVKLFSVIVLLARILKRPYFMFSEIAMELCLFGNFSSVWMMDRTSIRAIIGTCGFWQICPEIMGFMVCLEFIVRCDFKLHLVETKLYGFPKWSVDSYGSYS